MERTSILSAENNQERYFSVPLLVRKILIAGSPVKGYTGSQMPKIIDHKQRKIAILRQAFSLFAEHGYQNTSLSHLAEACGISRPTLYLYFRDKEEIFTYAVKYYTDEMFSDYRDVAAVSGPVLPQIRKIVADIIFKSWHNRDFITSLGDFIFQKRQEDRNFPAAIRRRTVKLDHLLRRMLRQGIENGELRSIPLGSHSHAHHGPDTGLFVQTGHHQQRRSQTDGFRS
jgi:TetR/AcrR family transcriptional regulator